MAGLVALMMLATMVGDSPAVGAQTQSPAAVLHLALAQDDGSLTPYTFESAYPFLTLIYDTLMWRDANGIPQPWLARTVDTSPDGRTVTLRLAESAHWQDGQPVTSDDVAFTFAYVAAHPHPRFTPELAAVDHVDAPDSSTVIVSLRGPSPGFFDQPLSELPILPAHLWRGLPVGKIAPDGLPIGSGPYRLVEHQSGQSYRFQAVTDYFRGAPRVAEIDVAIIGTADAAFSAAARHTVDMVPYKLPLDQGQQLPNLALRLARGPSYQGTVLTLNVRRAPFDRQDARAAVAAAIDLTRMAREVGDAVPADHGYLHPLSPWAPAKPLPTTDIAAAKAALARLGLPTIEVLAPSDDPVKREAARQVALALQRAGQQAVARPVSATDFARGVSGDQPSFMAAVETIPPLVSYDPDFLRHLFGSHPAQAQLNHSGYRSAAFDTSAETMATTTDPAARQAAVADALTLLAHDVPAVPLLFVNGTFAYRPSAFNGWVYIKGTGILDKRSFVEPSRQKALAVAGAAETAGGGGRGFPWTLAFFAVLAAAAAGIVAELIRGRE